MSDISYPYFDRAIRVDKLVLDKNNPRLPDYIQGKEESKIIEHLLLEESTLELMQAIGDKGFFPGEQLLAVKQEDNTFKVVEGNRRLTSVKLLNNPSDAPAQKSLVIKIAKEAKQENTSISTLPCMIFEKEEDIHDYLGYKHVTGIQPWNLRQKAKYLSFLRENNFADLSLDDASNELRKMIGSKKRVVKRYLVGYSIYTIIKDSLFFRIKDLDEEGFYFSYIADSLSRSNITNFLGVDFNIEKPLANLNIDNLKSWTNWLFEPIENTGRKIRKTRLKGKSEDLNKLNAILGNEIAREKFISEESTLEDAYSYTEVYEKIFLESIKDSLSNMEKANNIVHKVNNYYSSYEDDLRDIINLSRSIKSSIDKLKINEFEGDEFGE